MPLAIVDHELQLEVPSFWPSPLRPRELDALDLPTPFLAIDLDTIRDRYETFASVLPGVECFYAIKCNSEPGVLEALAELGSHFEIASRGELELVTALGVDPADVLYSNPVKPPAHIASTYDAGVWRFAFDSEAELYKIARNAPGSAVFARVRVDDSTSVFPLSRKFGVEPHDARALLLLARRLGLRPYGLTFHVGSQSTDPEAWHAAVTSIGDVLRDLAEDRVHVEMLNVGGGFPARYTSAVPPLEDIADAIFPALTESLPYVPPRLAAEPGRFLVAEAAILASGVIGREVRAGQSWIYLDVGAYNGLIETQQTRNRWRYPLWSSRADHASVPHDLFTVTGPSCDSSDTLFMRASLPSTIDVGDRLYIGSAGAYTLSYASSFNGFPPPEVVYPAVR